MKPNDGQVPAQLADLQRRFEHWRSTRTRLGRIPEPLWDSAVRLPSSVAIAFSFLAVIWVTVGLLLNRFMPSDRKDDFTFLQIDVGQMPAGIYKLVVTAVDIGTGQRAERDVLFRVIE